jgi:hypothetical protein
VHGESNRVHYARVWCDNVIINSKSHPAQNFFFCWRPLNTATNPTRKDTAFDLGPERAFNSSPTKHHLLTWGFSMSKYFSYLTRIGVVAGAALGASPNVYADGFELSEKLTVTGFIDMSYSVTEPENGGSSTSSGLDQFEIDFLYDFGQGLTAQVDLEYQDNGSGEEVDIEQAFISYGVSDSLSIKAGRFLSYSGWETEEPTGLFQYSGTGYAKYFYGGYQQGVSALYSGDRYSVALSAVSDLGDLEGEARDSSDPGFEFMLALNPVEAWTVKGFYMTDKLDGTSKNTDLINIWTSYIAGGLTLAAEVNTSENAPAAVGFAGVGAEAKGYLLMANYGWDKFGLTFRYHESEVEDATGDTLEELSAFTIAPSYAVSDNLLVVLEYRRDEDDITNESTNSFAIEALVTF